MDIEDIVTREFTEVDSGERLGKVRSTFESENLKGVIVTDDGAYAGVITEKQLLQSHVEDNTKAAAMMRNAPKVDRREDVRDVARMLVEGGVKVAPVFDGEKLYGIISENAILEAVLDNLDVLTVGDIYTEEVISVPEDATVGKVINIMRENGVSRVPVTNENGYLSGLVTTHDITDIAVRNMDKATRGDRGGDLERVLDIPVYDVMTSPVDTADPGDSVRDAVERMLEGDYGGLVVTGDDDRLIAGIVTKTDVLRALTYTEEDHMDVQVTNVEVLDTITREEIVASIEEVSDKYADMQVQHAHVRFKQHKEKLRGTPLIYAQIRLRTNVGQMAGSGEGYGAESAFRVALDKLERNVVEVKGVQADEEYEGQLLRKLGEL
ncbi:CBS domain-containing protein [Halosegnis marinus]|uniref:CBS domain-containing protein n=1 Tax=Halosegnis marinus TaxID=3034023 RepID=A0ABD5ZL99_9EURY|nr:CBS domain-containing protein [Halosegnis sp. DT85]